jgi:transcription-repair coupling factor (superfamily II helicase)
MAVELNTLSAVDAIAKEIKKSPHRVEVVGPWGSAKSLTAAQTALALDRPLVFLCAGRIEAEAVYDDLCTFAGEERVALFPAWEVLPSDTMNPSDDIVAERLDTMRRLATALEDGEALFLVLPVRSLMQRVVGRKHLTSGTLTLEVGGEIELDALLERLIKLGYTREVMVENRGEVSVRGGIVDIFPISAELPYRFEFFGDEIESIRRFEPETQRSVSNEQRVQVLPRSEKALLTRLESQQGGLEPLTAYFPEHTLIVIDEPMAVIEESRIVERQAAGSKHVLTWEDAEKAMARFAQLHLAQVAMERAGEFPRVKMPSTSIAGWAGHAQDFWDQLERWGADGYTVQLLCVNSGERRRLMSCSKSRAIASARTSFDLHVDLGRLRAGFACRKTSSPFSASAKCLAATTSAAPAAASRRARPSCSSAI